MCCVLFPLNSGMLLAVISIKPVPIGSYRYQTSLLFYSLYCVGPVKILFVKLSSSTFSCTVFLYNVFDDKGDGEEQGARLPALREGGGLPRLLSTAVLWFCVYSVKTTVCLSFNDLSALCRLHTAGCGANHYSNIQFKIFILQNM